MGIPLARPSLSLSLSLSRERERERESCRSLIAFNNTAQEPHRIFVFYPLFKDFEESGVIYAVEEFSDIAFQNEAFSGAIPAYAAGFALQNIHPFMRAKPDPARERRRDERFFKDRIQHRKYRVMQNAVADFRFMDMSLLWIGNVEAVITAMAVGLALQIPMELEKVLFDMPLEFNDIPFVFLIRLERFPRRKKIFHRNYFPEKVAIGFHKN